MKRSKSQAIYKYLPNTWISFTDRNDTSLGGRSYSFLVSGWNTKELTNVFNERLSNEIARQIDSFNRKGGNTGQFADYHNPSAFTYVEASIKEGIPSIVGKIDPLLFYCSRCGRVRELSDESRLGTNRICPICKEGSMKQMAFAYTCECGYAAGITLPHKGGYQGEFRYDYKKRENRFRFLLHSNGAERPIEMIEECPNCGRMLRPKNAMDPMNFRPALINIVNLIDENEGTLFHYGIRAKKIIIGQWLGAVSEAAYRKLLKNPRGYFEAEGEDQQAAYAKLIQSLVDKNMDIETARMVAQTVAETQEASTISVDRLVSDSEKDIPISDEELLEVLASEFIEFETIKRSPRFISLEQAMEAAKKNEAIQDPRQVTDLHSQLGIADVQLSYDIQLITCAYGFTRKKVDPMGMDPGRTLRLNSFGTERDRYRVFCNTLDTEGLLLEIDRKKIIDWLVNNHLYPEAKRPDEKDEVSMKKWFMENIDVREINQFSEIDSDNTTNLKQKLTKHVYTLLHTISHTLIRSAGVHSGLDRNSIAEKIFPNVPAVFIYAQSSQGVPLGALSGMFEQDYVGFLKQAYDDNQVCIYDPICSQSTVSKGACDGCIFVSDISCCHFNHDLNRLYLYGDNSEGAIIKHGFWG